MTRTAKVLRGAGELLITFGLVLLLFCAYELWGTGLYTRHEQQQLQDSLRGRWGPSLAARDAPRGDDSGPAEGTFRYPDVPVGKSFAVLWIPALGEDYHYAIVQGAGAEQLKKGPGHFLGGGADAMPGQVGNFVVSGHRTTYLAPFKRVDRLLVGDAIIVETDDVWFTYRVRSKRVVAPTALEVAAPVPFHAGKKPAKRRITLTTCHPMYTARQRLIIFGELTRARPKSAGRPPALTTRGDGASTRSQQ